MDKPFIGIAGNIGVGKTTFSEIVSKKFIDLTYDNRYGK